MDNLPKCQSSQNPLKVIKSEDHDHDKKVTVNLPLDLPRCEFVFSIDHILEQIFSYLSTRDLFVCRKVSHRFLKVAQIPLENQISLSFTLDYWHKLPGLDGRFTGRTLEQLTEFVKKSKSASALKPRAKLISFPCTHFWMDSSRRGDKILQDFLDVNGPNIRKLSLRTLSTDNIHENILMKKLGRLLTVQAPNLDYLRLVADPIVEWQEENSYENQGPRSRNSALFRGDPEFRHICSRVESLKKKSSLKILEIRGSGWAKTVEFLLQLTPKLEQVNYSGFYSDYLLKPETKIHLLKDFVFAPDSHLGKQNGIDMETMEKYSPDHNLRLTKLEIDFSEALEGCKTSPRCEKNVVMMTNRLLKGSRNTLESLVLSSVTFLRGMEIPSSMSNVGELTIIDTFNRYPTDTTIFPLDFSLDETFPKLSVVQITLSGKFDEVTVFNNYLKRFVFGRKGTPLSFLAKEVILIADCFRTKKGRGSLIPTFTAERIQKLFPNAVIRSQAYKCF